MDYALSSYPLSHDFRAAFEEHIGARPRYLSLAELRRLALPVLLRELWSLRGDRLFVVLEDETSRALLPVLHGLAALTRTSRIDLVGPDFAQVALPRWRAGVAIAGLAAATLAGRASIRGARRELAELAAAKRVSVGPLAPGRALYLKSSLALGLRAGGSVGHTAGVANALAECGRGIDFVSAETPIGLAEAVGRLHVDPPTTYGLPPEVNLYRFDARFARRASELAHGRDYALVYQRLTLGSYAGVVLSRALGLPYVLEYNGPEAWAAMHWGTPLRYQELAERAEEVCLRHAHLVVAISAVLRDQLLERGVESERIVFHPNGIDPTLFDSTRYDERATRALRRRYGIAEDAVVATFVGTFGDWHGAEVLAQAIRRSCG